MLQKEVFVVAFFSGIQGQQSREQKTFSLTKYMAHVCFNMSTKEFLSITERGCY